MSIHKFAEYPTEQRGNSTMLATSGWLGMQLWYPQAHSLISWLTQLFHPARNFPSVALYNCEAVQYLATKSTISL